MKMLKNMRYVAFGLVVLLGVVGQTNASSWFSRKKTTPVVTAQDADGVPGVQPAQRSLVDKMLRRNKPQPVAVVPNKSAVVVTGADGEFSADTKGGDSPIDSGYQPSQAAPAPTTWQRFKQVVVPGQKMRDLYAARDYAGAMAATKKSWLGRRIEKTADADVDTGKQTSYLNKKYLGISTADHRFLGNTRDAIGRAGQSVSAGFTRAGESVGTGFARMKKSVGTGFAAARQALTPEQGLLGRARAAVKNRGLAGDSEERVLVTNKGIFGGTRAKLQKYRAAKAKKAALAAQNEDEQNLGVLGLSAGASNDEINSAYRKIAIQMHPDKAGNSPAAIETFRRATQARDALLRPETLISENNGLMLTDAPASSAMSTNPSGGASVMRSQPLPAINPAGAQPRASQKLGSSSDQNSGTNYYGVPVGGQGLDVPLL